jgi:hypothetical protein
MPKTLAASRASRRGRPSVHDEAWSKVSVVLMDRQVARLDRLVMDIQRASGAALTRAGLIRALVDGVIDSGFDVTSSASEVELRRRLTRRLRAGPRARKPSTKLQ